MPRSFNTGRRTGTTVPRIQEIQYEPGQVFKNNALVVLNSNGNVQECGADPTSVTGVVLNGAGTLPGFDVANSSQTTVYTGRRTKVSVALADREQEFSARGVNGGTDPVIPLQSHIGKQYGVAKVADDWVIDISDTTNVVVQITDAIPGDGKNFFLCKFLEAVVTVP